MRVEVLGGIECRRRWSRDDKMRIIEETFAPGAVVTEIARRHGIATSLVFTWRRARLTSGQRAAAMYSLIVTAKMNGIDPQAWLADVLSRIAAHPAHRLDELLPRNWTPPASAISVRAA